MSRRRRIIRAISRPIERVLRRIRDVSLALIEWGQQQRDARRAPLVTTDPQRVLSEQQKRLLEQLKQERVGTRS